MLRILSANILMLVLMLVLILGLVPGLAQATAASCRSRAPRRSRTSGQGEIQQCYLEGYD